MTARFYGGLTMLRFLPTLCFLLMLSAVTDAKIVFKSAREGHYAIYVMEDDGSNVQRLTDAPFDESYPVWSPDGTQIAFSRYTDNEGISEIFLMNADGSSPKNLTNHPVIDTAPSWSPDGHRIAFVSHRGDLPWNIFSIEVNSKKVTRLTHNKKREDGGADFPCFSPDGTHIIYTQSAPGEWRSLYMMDSDGRRHWAFIPLDGLFRTFPRWSPDGRKILFTEVQYDAKINVISEKIVIRERDTRIRTVLKIPRRLVLADNCCWMDRGKSVLIAAKELADPDRGYDIYRYHLASDEITNLTNSPGSDRSADWIDDAVLDVSLTGKKSTTWGELKANIKDDTAKTPKRLPSKPSK